MGLEMCIRDSCQRLGKGAVSPPAPLHSLPPVSEPFCQITLGVHHMELLPNAQPICSAPYRLHPEKDVFFRKELKNSAHISSVLSDLLQSRSRFEWTKEADAAYLDLASPSGYTTTRPPASSPGLLTHRERGTFSCPRCSLPYPCAIWVVTVYTDLNPLLYFAANGQPQPEAPSLESGVAAVQL